MRARQEGALGRSKKARKVSPVADPPPAPVGRRSRAGLIALGLALALGAAFAAWRLTPAPVRREAGLDVLLVTIDTLRADALGCYGNATVETPWIDRLAREGVRFERAHAQNVVTLPSHTNILTGRYPPEHGLRDNPGVRLPERPETPATILPRPG